MTKSLQKFNDFQIKRLVAPIRGDYKIYVSQSGCEPKLLPSIQVWLHGPPWLHDEANWSNISHDEIDMKLPEIEDQLTGKKRSVTAFLARTTL
jgi:hypothetical protein